MLDGASSWRLHFAQNAALIAISLLFLPIDTLVVAVYYILQCFQSHNGARRRIRQSRGFRPKTILVTGVGMTKGLTLARMFYQTGHNVVGADFEPYDILVCGRLSKAISKFYSLSRGSTTYAQDLLEIIQKEKVDLWISCSGVASAVSDGHAQELITQHSPSCRAIQFNATTTSTLHEKHTFISQTSHLGLPIPETHNVTSRAAVHKVLNAPTLHKKYILKAVGVDDATRGDMTLLPRRTMSETYSHIATVPISPSTPWVLQQYIRGQEFCTHALVVDGVVRAFLACPSSELLMHYEALRPETALFGAMLRFTQAFAGRSGGDFTGHLSFDFLVEELVTERGVEMVLQPIECNPRAHTAVALFVGREKELVEAYLGALGPKINGTAVAQEREVVTVGRPPGVYWVGHDVVTLLLYPLLDLLQGRMAVKKYLQGCMTFLQHLLFWKDGTFEIWDPLPWWWLYHVYWPGQFLWCILQRRKWSRVNVSTTKMFGC
ncbi:MAG: hypothetical protein Q9195_007737 [Heterodermia aff. obscurata]